jgi:hypothetical protein
VSYFASVAGLQVVSGTLLIPLVGAWTADLQLATAQPIAGAVEVVIGNLTLQGFVVRAEAYGGQVRARLVGGAGGWRKSISAQGYGSAQGVKLSTVLQDAAAACGEQLQVFADVTIGQAYVRASFGTSVASDVLWQMLRLGYISAWYVDPAGVTQTGPWPITQVATPFIPTDAKPDEGLVVVATEDYASWLPGATFAHPLLDGTQTAAGVHFVFDGEGIARFEVLTGAAGLGGQDRVLGPVQQIVEREVAPLRFFGRYAYTISNPSPATIDGTPVSSTLGIPDVQNVPLTGDSLASYTPPSGGRAHVMFLDGDPTQPVCVWTEASSSNGPDTIAIAPQKGGQKPVALVDGTVIVMFPPLIQLAGTVGGAPFIGVATITSPATGIIQTGSGTLQAPS